ncbi:hypothetical protein AB0F42_14085 [Streptomyces buecherae]|uniref:hypothetical protein n=1 Tax=Streptomyces buecherae TaxID=2763006 RepID=UPI0033E9C5B8
MLADTTAAASAATAHAHAALARRHPDRFTDLLWYGAVELDPTHLVVWVLLAGPPEQIPEWRLTTAEDDSEPDVHAMRRLVVEEFERVGWPSASSLRVGFESAERVAAGGGRHYFR